MRAKSRKSVAHTGWRASWKGDLRFGLVRFSVEAINAYSRAEGDIHFHQLHEKCHSRVQYQKVCPIHGEVEQDEIVLGYEYGRGKYVEIDPDELEAARTQEERTLSIEEFVAPSDLDQIYLDGRMYYLAPASARDREPYHLMRRAMEEDDRIGIGQVVFSGKEQLAAILPREQMVVMAMLNYGPELRDPESVGVGDDSVRVSAENLKLAKNLIRSMTSRRFNIDSYKDHYRERVQELIDAKRKGKAIIAPEEEQEEPVINLMEALKRSLPKTRSTSKSSSRPASRSASHPTKKRSKAV